MSEDGKRMIGFLTLHTLTVFSKQLKYELKSSHFVLVSPSAGGNSVNGNRIVPQFLWPCRIHVTAPIFTKRAKKQLAFTASWLTSSALLFFCLYLIYRQSSISNKISSQRSISHCKFFSCLFLLTLTEEQFHSLGLKKAETLMLSTGQWILFSFALSLLASSGQAQEWGAPGPTEIWAICHHAQQSWFCGVNYRNCCHSSQENL